MKKLIPIFILLAEISLGQVSIINTNFVELNLEDTCDGSYSDFNFQWSGYDDQRMDFNFNQGSLLYSNANIITLRLTAPKEGTIYLEELGSPTRVDSDADITLSSLMTNIHAIYDTTDPSLTNRITFVIGTESTNIPPRRTYFAELMATYSGTPGAHRSLAQGTVSITHSLYNNDVDYFEVSRTNAEVGQIYVHPEWVNTPSGWGQWLTSAAGLSDVVTVTITGATANVYVNPNLSAFINDKGYITATNIPGVGTMAFENTINYYNISQTDALLEEKADTNTTAAIDTRVTTLEDIILTNVVVTAGETNNAYFDNNEIIIQFSEGYNMFRYEAMDTENEEIYVVATTTNVTAKRVGTVITMTIPEDTKVLSMRIRWDGSLGSTFTLDMGTNDMDNASLSDRWGALFQAYREDTGALIAGAQCRLDVSNHGKLTVQGLWTGGINHLRFGF